MRAHTRVSATPSGRFFRGSLPPTDTPAGGPWGRGRAEAPAGEGPGNKARPPPDRAALGGSRAAEAGPGRVAGEGRRSRTHPFMAARSPAIRRRFNCHCGSRSTWAAGRADQPTAPACVTRPRPPPPSRRAASHPAHARRGRAGAARSRPPRLGSAAHRLHPPLPRGSTPTAESRHAPALSASHWAGGSSATGRGLDREASTFFPKCPGLSDCSIGARAGGTTARIDRYMSPRAFVSRCMYLYTTAHRDCWQAFMYHCTGLESKI